MKAFRLGFSPDLRQPADAVTLQTAVKRGAPQMRDGRLKRIEIIIERQQRQPAKGDDGRLLLGREDGRARRLRPHQCVFDGGPLAPLRDRLSVDVVLPGERAHAFLAALDGSADGLRRSGAAV